jgi:hypothetical protein
MGRLTIVPGSRPSPKPVSQHKYPSLSPTRKQALLVGRLTAPVELWEISGRSLGELWENSGRTLGERSSDQSSDRATRKQARALCHSTSTPASLLPGSRPALCYRAGAVLQHKYPGLSPTRKQALLNGRLTEPPGESHAQVCVFRWKVV